MRSVHGRTWTLALVAGLAAILSLVGPALAAPADDLRQADAYVQAAHAAAKSGDAAAANASFQQFRDAWRGFEDDVNAADPQRYDAIETAMRAARVALQASPPDLAAAATALDQLHEENAAFATGTATPVGSASTAATDADRMAELLSTLATARASIAHQDTAGAILQVRAFQAAWPAAEGLVKAKSPAAYTATENDMAEAEALLVSQPPRISQADEVLGRMHERLAPIAESGASYGVFDAFTIMLREGLEALLVVSALLAFLKRSDNADKQGWIWGGAAAGVLLSLALAVGLQQVFSRAGASIGSELVEGIVGITAAAMLFYVSYWLHAKAQVGAWQKYIQARSAAALASGGMLSLSTIAFLAVFREGAETAVFYLGIAPSIALTDLALGVGLGVLALAAVGAAIIMLGRRLPLRPFFLASSALIYYLGFKFVGTGLHALQVADVLPATPAPIPASDLLGVYPTWETLLPQLALLGLAALVLVLATREHPAPGTVAA